MGSSFLYETDCQEDSVATESEGVVAVLEK